MELVVFCVDVEQVDSSTLYECVGIWAVPDPLPVGFRAPTANNHHFCPNMLYVPA